MKDLNINNIYITQSEVIPNTFYFSDDEIEVYWTINLEDTDDFIEFTTFIEQEYPSQTSERVREYFNKYFTEECGYTD